MNLFKSFIKACRSFKSKPKPTTYMHVINLDHKKGVVKITIESNLAELTAHVSNSIKHHFNHNTENYKKMFEQADKAFEKSDEAFRKADEAFREIDKSFYYRDKDDYK